MRNYNRLSAIKVARLKKPGRYGDGLNLYLQVAGEGERLSKSWLFRYRVNGASHEMGLGPIHTISLAEARDKALQYRKLVFNGIDPLATLRETRRAAKVEQSPTFKECATRYIEAHKAGWASAKQPILWKGTMETYAYPVIGSLPVATVDTDHIRPSAGRCTPPRIPTPSSGFRANGSAMKAGARIALPPCLPRNGISP
jgi:hypothetical protein